MPDIGPKAPVDFQVVDIKKVFNFDEATGELRISEVALVIERGGAILHASGGIPVYPVQIGQAYSIPGKELRRGLEASKVEVAKGRQPQMLMNPGQPTNGHARPASH